MSLMSAPPAVDGQLCEALIKTESSWILSLQTPQGALLMNRDEAVGRGEYNPYFACYTLLGLLETGQHFDVVKRYMDYHIAHLNAVDVHGVPGTIYDYSIDLATYEETTKGAYDSVDSYAALMLQLMKKYAEVSGDEGYLKDKKATVLLLTAAIDAMMDDGLTWAKSTYKVKYLMDNCEVLQGLQDAAWLFDEVYGDAALARRYAQAAKAMKRKIQSVFYDEATGRYASAMTEDGLVDSRSDRFYPDAVCQLSPILAGVIPAAGAEAKRIYQAFHAAWRWTQLDCADHAWGILLLAAHKMGDGARIESFLQTALERLQADGHRHPWYCAEAGFVVWAACLSLNE